MKTRCFFLLGVPRHQNQRGLRLDRRSRLGKPRFAVLLRQSALGLHRSHSALGERYRRLRSRLGAPKALIAMAHLLLRIIYKPVTEGLEYHNSIYAKMESEHQQNRLNHLQATAKKLGFDLVRTFNPLAQYEHLRLNFPTRVGRVRNVYPG